MPRITLDPTLEVCPEFGGDGYAPFRNAFIAASNVTPEQAIQQLIDAWEAGRAERQALWDQQELQDQQAKDDEQRIRDEARQAQADIDEAERENERKEKEKKKPKFAAFDADSSVKDDITPRPSSFALNKLDHGDYVELWYFTPDGCADAAAHSHSVAEDAFGIAKVDGFMALRPVASFKAAKNVVRDRDLTWRQLSMGKSNFLECATKADWPIAHLRSLALFFAYIEDSPLRNKPNGEQTLIVYQAKVRLEWHDSLKRGECFNIAIFNERLLRSIGDDVWENQRAESLREVSKNFLQDRPIAKLTIPPPHPSQKPRY